MPISNYGAERPNPSYEPPDTDPATGGDTSLDDFIALIQGKLAKQGQSWINTGNEQVLVDANGTVIQRLPINKSTAGGGSSSSYNVSDVGATSASLQRTNQELDRLQLQQKTASDAALLALQQGNAQEARRQFDISSQLAQQRLQLDQQSQAERASEFQRSQALDESKLGFDVYKNRQDTASAPRNWLSSFFENRNRQAPEAAQRTGNSQFAAGDYRNFNQSPFQPLQNQPTQAATSVAGTPGVQPTTASGSAYEGENHFNTDGTITVSRNDPDTQNPDFFTKHPNYHFAKGGTLRMMGPHAVVDMMTGQVKGIAGEAGPETAKFSGMALIDTKGEGDISNDPYSQYFPGTGTDPFTPINSSGTLTGSAPVNSTSTGTTAPVQGWTPEQLQQMIDAANAGNAARNTQQTTTTTTQDDTIQPPPPPLPPTEPPKPPIIEPPQPEPITPAPEAPPTFIKPMFTPPPPPPLSSTSFAPPPSGGNMSTGPSKFNGPADLTGFPAQNNPNSILSQLNQSNAIPPFLRRILEQQRGNQAFGTDVPQPFTQAGNGTDVPLLSKMAISQMSPSELAAFKAYISAYGIDPEDYFAQIEASSPHPEQFISRPIGPRFLYTEQ